MPEIEESCDCGAPWGGWHCAHCGKRVCADCAPGLGQNYCESCEEFPLEHDGRWADDGGPAIPRRNQ